MIRNKGIQECAFKLKFTYFLLYINYQLKATILVIKQLYILVKITKDADIPYNNYF